MSYVDLSRGDDEVHRHPVDGERHPCHASLILTKEGCIYGKQTRGEPLYCTCGVFMLRKKPNLDFVAF